MKELYVIVLLLVLISCGSPKETATATTDPGSEISSETNAGLVQERDGIRVRKLESFFDQPGYYVTLYLKTEDPYSDGNYVPDSLMTLLHREEETIRKLVPVDIAQTVFATTGLDSVLAFDQNQDLIDTLLLDHFEYYETMIESAYIASYTVNDRDQPVFLMSLGGMPELSGTKSPVMRQDDDYLSSLIKSNGLDPMATYTLRLTNVQEEVYALLSVFDEEDWNFSHILFQNGQPMDTLETEYFMKRFQPVPVASDSSVAYLIDVQIPDTDASWSMLMGIDLLQPGWIVYDDHLIETGG